MVVKTASAAFPIGNVLNPHSATKLVIEANTIKTKIPVIIFTLLSSG
jgi:hypothetical protein